MRKIFAIIFLLPLVHTLAGAEPEFSGESAPGVAEALHDEARMLAGIFRSPWNRSNVKLTVIFSPAVPAGSIEVRRSGREFVLLLCGVPDERQHGFTFRRKLFSVLLAAAAGKSPAGGALLPPWAAAALEHRLRSGKHEERLLAGNRRAPVLGALAEREKLPPVETVLRTDPRNFDPAARFWMEELSRVLFSLGGRKVASTAYLRNFAENADAAFLASDPKARQHDFSVAFYRVAWHTLAPRPARYSLKKFSEVRKLQLPQLDEAGRPIQGKFEECDLAEIDAKLKGRPDAEQLAAQFKKRIFDFAAGDSRQVKSAIFALAELTGAAAHPPFRYRVKLERAIENVISEMRRREKIDAYMRAADFDRAPVRRAFRRRLECIDFYDRGSSLLSPGGREWLDRREREFL